MGREQHAGMVTTCSVSPKPFSSSIARKNHFLSIPSSHLKAVAVRSSLLSGALVSDLPLKRQRHTSMITASSSICSDRRTDVGVGALWGSRTSQAEETGACPALLSLPRRDARKHSWTGQTPESGRRQVLFGGGELPAHVGATRPALSNGPGVPESKSVSFKNRENGTLKITLWSEKFIFHGELSNSEVLKKKTQALKAFASGWIFKQHHKETFPNIKKKDFCKWNHLQRKIIWTLIWSYFKPLLNWSSHGSVGCYHIIFKHTKLDFIVETVTPSCSVTEAVNKSHAWKPFLLSLVDKVNSSTKTTFFFICSFDQGTTDKHKLVFLFLCFTKTSSELHEKLCSSVRERRSWKELHEVGVALALKNINQQTKQC